MDYTFYHLLETNESWTFDRLIEAQSLQRLKCADNSNQESYLTHFSSPSTVKSGYKKMTYGFLTELYMLIINVDEPHVHSIVSCVFPGL